MLQDSQWSPLPDSGFCFLFLARKGCKSSLPTRSATASHPVSLPTLPIFTLNNRARGYQGLPVAIVRGDGASLPKRWTLGSKGKHNLSCCIWGFD